MFCFVGRRFRAVALSCVLVTGLGLAAQMPHLPAPETKESTTAPVALPPSNPASPPRLTAEDLTAFLDGFLPLQLQRDDVAGATISVVQNGQILLLKGYGYADWKKKTPVDPAATTFRPGSISKLFTYVAMMQMVEQGKLALDTDVNRYLDFAIAPGPAGIGAAPITLRQLATHTAGFEEEVHDFGSDKSGKLPLDLRSVLLRNQPHRFAAPGKALAYSNYGITLIGYIVQRASGEPFAEYIERHIFAPLRMAHSTFQQPLPAGLEASHGYLTTSKPDTGFEGVSLVPAGGLSSTAADMAVFGQMLLGQGSFRGQTILSPASVATLLSPQFTPAPGVAPWNLGFYTERRNGLDFVGHGGDLLACHSQFWIERTHGLVFFVSYNSAGAAKSAREELFRAVVDRYLPGAPAHPAYVKLSEKELGAYAGYYLSSRRAESTKFRLLDSLNSKLITANKDGYLTNSAAKDFRGEQLRFHPMGNDSFYEEEGQSVLHFERDGSGRVTGYASPGHSDRTPVPERRPLLTFPLLGSMLTMLAICVAPVVRGWKRVFHRNRPRPAPQLGTAWFPAPMKVAAVACLVVFVQTAALLTHLANVASFYEVGHLDGWFSVQNVLSLLAVVALTLGIASALAALRKPLRFITKIKFGVATVASVYLIFFLLYFHFVGNAHVY